MKNKSTHRNASSRRQFLSGAGVSMALPFLPSLGFSQSGDGSANSESLQHRRMVCIGNMLGFYPPAFWPDLPSQGNDSGLTIHREFTLGPTSNALDAIKDQMTIIQGLEHGTSGGHFSIHTFLSGVRHIDAKSMPLGNVTIDQFAAEQIPGQTRFPTLTIGDETGIHGGCQISWTKTGTRVPPIPGPEQLFKKLFVQMAPGQKAVRNDQFKLQASILDVVRDEANRIDRKLNSQDRQKLEEYLTSVREVEKRIGLRKNWIDIPKPDAPFAAPKNKNLVEDLPLLYELIALALQTNSTRIATLELGGEFNPRDLGISAGYHGLSHHGKKQSSIDALIKLESYQLQEFTKFVQRLASIEDESGRLLDNTMVLFGSGMGDANSHTNTNLPIVFAGGGFDHGRVMEFDRQHRHRPPLTNLFVTMLQSFGLETEQFSTSTGTLRGFA